MPTFSFSFGKNSASNHFAMTEQLIDTLYGLETVVMSFKERIEKLEQRMNALDHLEQDVTEQDEDFQDKFMAMDKRIERLEVEPMHSSKFDEDVQSALVILEVVSKDHEERLGKLDGADEFLKWVQDEDEQVVGNESDDGDMPVLRSGHENSDDGSFAE